MTRLVAFSFCWLAPLVANVLLGGCGKGGDDDGGGSTGGTDSFTGSGPHTHSSSDPSAVSMTFTNTGDPTSDPSSDPTTDPSGDPTTDPSGDPTGESSAETTAADSESGGHESSGAAEGSSTSAGETGNPGGACCEAQDGPGCGDAAIEACVCARESFCCDVQWDLYCTVQVVLLACDECPGIGGDGDCCAAHDNPGCDDDEIEACVCEQDLACCTEGWDDVCVGQVTGSCGQC